MKEEVTQQSLFQQIQAHCQKQQILFRYSWGKEEKQMESLPEEHNKRQLNQDSSTVCCPKPELKSAKSKNNC